MHLRKYACSDLRLATVRICSLFANVRFYANPSGAILPMRKHASLHSMDDETHIFSHLLNLMRTEWGAQINK